VALSILRDGTEAGGRRPTTRFTRHCDGRESFREESLVSTWLSPSDGECGAHAGPRSRRPRFCALGSQRPKPDTEGCRSRCGGFESHTCGAVGGPGRPFSVAPSRGPSCPVPIGTWFQLCVFERNSLLAMRRARWELPARPRGRACAEHGLSYANALPPESAWDTAACTDTGWRYGSGNFCVVCAVRSGDTVTTIEAAACPLILREIVDADQTSRGQIAATFRTARSCFGP